MLLVFLFPGEVIPFKKRERETAISGCSHAILHFCFGGQTGCDRDVFLSYIIIALVV